MNADDVYEALKRRHKTPEWVLFRELRLGTGWDYGIWDNGKYMGKAGMSSRIDAWAINCYQGQDFKRIAYEIKVARADFVAEKLNPDKRRPAKAVSHYFYFAAPRGLIAPMEVPKDCGLLVVYDTGRSQILKRAPRLDPERLDWRFVASLARNLAKARRRDLPEDRFEY